MNICTVVLANSDPSASLPSRTSALVGPSGIGTRHQSGSPQCEYAADFD